MTQLGSGQAALMSLIEQVNLRIQKQMLAKGSPDVTMPKTIESGEVVDYSWLAVGIICLGVSFLTSCFILPFFKKIINLV